MNKYCLWAVGRVMAFLLFVLSMAGCINTNSNTGVIGNATLIADDSDYRASPTTSELNFPDYLEYVWPEPSSSMTVADYSNSITTSTIPMARGIGAAINGAEVDIDLSDGASTILPQRLTLIIDGEVVPNETLEFADGLQKYDLYIDGKFIETEYVGPYYVSWGRSVDPGQHVVQLQIEQDSGAALTYEWKFEIVDDEM